jgi:archaellum component FlaF (FlaF/FlaG flagellin family)
MGSDVFRLRFALDSDFSIEEEGMGVDDVLVSTSFTDLSVADINVQGGSCASSNRTITATLQNTGATTIAASDYEVGYRIDGSNMVTEQGSSEIAPGETVTHTFSTTADLSSSGTRTLEAFVNFSADEDSSNNSVMKDMTFVPIVNFMDGGDGYTEGFEQDNGGWSSMGENSSWEHGMPDATFIPSAASGSQAWVTNLTGEYNTSELSYLVSPCLDMSALSNDPTLAFQHIFKTESGFDEGWLEISTDGGDNWDKLGTSETGSNWYNDDQGDWWDDTSGNAGEWRMASHILTDAAGNENVRIRFVLQTDGSVTEEGMGVDDVSITP